MKKLFINLPIADISTARTKVMPLSLLAIIAHERQKGHETYLIDMSIKTINYLINLLEYNKPHIIGISVMVAGQMQNAIQLTRLIKNILSGSTIILGGTHASQFAENILFNCRDIDLIRVGEYESEGGNAYILNDKMIINRQKKYIDINTLLMPAYDILDFEDYRSDSSSWHNPFGIDFGIRVPVFTSRGCPNTCNFCSVQTIMGYHYRAMTASKVVDIFQWLYENKGTTYFAIYDANFSQDTRRVIDICDEIWRRNLGPWLDIPAGLPVNISTSEMIDALVSVGLIRTKVAIENINDDIRNRVMKKRVKRDQIYKSIEIIRKHTQIHLTADFIIGMPEETAVTFKNTIDFIRDLDIDDIGINIATPYPFTKLWNQCIKDNLFTVDYRQLWNDKEYSHTNLSRFTIKPYEMEIVELFKYLESMKILKCEKQAKYEKRMIHR